MRARSLVLLAGCGRLHFADVADGGVALDVAVDAAPPVALACNTPVQLSTEATSNPHLSVAAVGTAAVAFWLDPNHQIVTEIVGLPTPTTVQPSPSATDHSGPWSNVSVAIDGTTLMVAVGSADVSSTGSSRAHPFSVQTGLELGGPMIVDARVESPRALAALGGAFALAGVGYNPGVEADFVRLDLTGAPATPLVRLELGNASTRTAALPNGAAIVTWFGPTIPCSASVIVSATPGFTATWGATGMCQQPMAIAASSTSVLLVRKDTSDGNLNHQVATINGQTISLPGEGKLANIADEPRGVAIGGTFWVAYRTDTGMVEAITVDGAGGKGTAHTLGPSPTLDAHDVFAAAGEPYAVWFDSGLWIAHLCP